MIKPNPPFTAAVIGLGNIGFFYDQNSKSQEILSHVKAYIEHPGFELIGAVETDASKRSEFQSKTGLPAYETVEDLFHQHGNIDCISVCTPTALHLKSIQEVANYLPKLILLEKPLALLEEQAREILNIVTKPTQLAVNYIRRWEVGCIAIKRIIDHKKLGEVTSLTCLYSKGLFNYASHGVDLLNFWFEGDSEIIPLRLKNAELEDPSADFLLRFETFDAYFHSLTSARLGLLELEIYFEEGKITFLNNGWSIQIHPFISPEQKGQKGAIYKPHSQIQQDMNRYQYNVMEGLFCSLTKSVPLISDGKSAMKALETCFEVQRRLKSSER